MHVKMLEKREIKLPSGAKNVKAVGWEGEVPDAIGVAWVDEGAAQCQDERGDNVAFTPDERAALKHVAAEVLQNAAQAELTLDDLDLDGLKEVANSLEMENFKGLGEDELRAALAAHLEAAEAEPVEEELAEDVTDADEAEDELQLADLSYDELVELAEKAEIEKPRSIKKDELLALLSEKAAETAATDSEAAE